MKKLMTSTIIILPLLLLAILLVSGAILSLVTHIYVESVEFSKKDAIVLVMDEDHRQTYNCMDEINVFPINAKNQDLTFTSSNEEVAQVSPQGIVTPVFYGETYITVQSRENLAAVAKRKVIVTGTTIQDFVLNDCPTDMYVGDRAQLSVSIYPKDALNKAQKWESDSPDILKVNANGVATAVGVGQAKITVTALGDQTISKTAIINCRKKTQEGFEVYCNSKQLQNGKTYKTFLDKLTFNVFNNQKTVLYQTSSSPKWQIVTDGKVTIDTNQDHNLSFKCGEETTAFTFNKVPFSKPSIEVFANVDSDEGASKMTLIEQTKEESVKLPLAKNVQDCFTIQVDLDEDIIGGFGDDENFAKNVGVDFGEAEGYEVSYDNLNSQIIISFPGMWEFDQNISLKFAGNKPVTLNLKRIPLAEVGFVKDEESYDSRNTTDIYKGYQQVSVFAKHSYYNGKQVDYFKVPFKALSSIVDKTSVSLDAITWNLSRYVENECEGILTSQLGDTVVFGNKTYKIVQDGEEYVLKDAQNLEGEAVSGKDGKNKAGIIWVDAFSEPGYARIYFGAFAGLKESDVQNDYFGNFDEKPVWTKPTPVSDTSGRDTKFYDGHSFTFLKVEAGDGAKGGESCHFNFNVLDDDSLVNVFDAEGYYKNKKVVLHTDLYGGEADLSAPVNPETGNTGYTPEDNVDEVPKTEENKDKFIRSYNTAELNKDLLYGNGHSVCFNARNEQKRKYTHPSKLGDSGGVTFGNVYNATIKGRNSTETVNELNHGVVFVFRYCFYSNLQHYYKASPAGAVSGASNNGQNGGMTYFKNCVINKAIKGIQLYYSGATVYFENTTISECLMAVCCEGLGGDGSGEGHNFKINFKGFNDVLNYHSCETLEQAMPDLGFLFPMMFPYAQGLETYAEWLGEKVPSANQITSQRFINSIVFLRCKGSYGKLDYEIKAWDGEKYDTAKDMVMGLDLTDTMGAQGWTYASTVDTDGGILPDGKKPTGRTMSELFSTNRYIRLLCQYKDYKNGSFVKNISHAMWHIQQVHRDVNLIEGREPNHIEDLKKSLAGVQWSDGSGVDTEGMPYAAADELNKALSCTTLPRRKDSLCIKKLKESM